MDPNLFHLDWERVAEVLVTVIVLAFFLERFLALLFENKWFVNSFANRGVKEPIAFVVALIVCKYWNFDALSTIVLSDRTRFVGELITAGVIAGGSKAAIKLFRDVMGVENDYAKQQRLRQTAAGAR